MNTYETLSLMIMFGMFVIAILSFNKKIITTLLQPEWL
ncbi:putative holin-like toxin [Thermoanaerobacterium sp. R66]